MATASSPAIIKTYTKDDGTKDRVACRVTVDYDYDSNGKPTKFETWLQNDLVAIDAGITGGGTAATWTTGAKLSESNAWERLYRDSSDTTKCKGEVEMIFSSDVDTYDDFNDNYFAYSDVCSGGSFFSEYLFNFNSIHSDISSFNTNGNGASVDLNDPLDIYQLIVVPEVITFGSNKYQKFKKYTIDQYKMYNRVVV